MGRPPLPVGTWGDITVHPTASGRYEARARYRDYDGITRHARRTGDTPRKAKTALTAALAGRAHTVGDEITADSRFDAVARIWADTLTERTEGTRRVYTWTLERHVLPALGAPPAPSSRPSRPCSSTTAQASPAHPASSSPRSWQPPSA